MAGVRSTVACTYNSIYKHTYMHIIYTPSIISSTVSTSVPVTSRFCVSDWTWHYNNLFDSSDQHFTLTAFTWFFVAAGTQLSFKSFSIWSRRSATPLYGSTAINNNFHHADIREDFDG